MYKLLLSIKNEMIKKKLILVIIFASLLPVIAIANEPKSLGKYKNWEAYTFNDGKGRVCFAQTKPTERSPKKLEINNARLFVSFRKEEKIKNEISVTGGLTYKAASVVAKSGKNEFAFNLTKGRFAWIQDQEEEFNLIKVMKKATKLSISATTTNGVKTKEMYSMMGFTKAYNTARKSCA